MTKWYHNSRTGEIDNYSEEGAGFELKGVLRAYGDAVTIGFDSKQKAIEWSKKWGYCEKCKGSSANNKDGKCFRCEGEIKFVKVKRGLK